MLGRGAPTSPGLLTNAAHRIARATARNRAIAHTRAPSSTVRSRPDHHPLDIHTADIERTAHTTGCELLDALRYDHHPGPGRKRPQIAITKNRILASDPDAPTAWNFSRLPRNRQQAAEDPKLLHSSKARERAFCHRFPSRARATANPRARTPSSHKPLPNHRQGTQACHHRPRPRIAGWPAPPPSRSGRTANTANTTAAQRSAATQQLRGTFADSARDRKLVDEPIAERRAEALAEDHTADPPRPRPGG